MELPLRDSSALSVVAAPSSSSHLGLSRSLSLLLLLLLSLASLLQAVSAATVVAGFDPNPNNVGDGTQTLSLYGDNSANANVVPYPVLVYIQRASGFDPAWTSFIVTNVDTTSTPGDIAVLPFTMPSGSDTSFQVGPIIMTIHVQLSSFSAGTYSQTYAITAENPASQTEGLQVTLTVHILSGVTVTVKTTDSVDPTIVNNGAPSVMKEGSDFRLTFDLHSLPTADVTITLTVNAQHGDFGGFTASGQPLSGGGPLLSLDRDDSVSLTTTTYTFTTANWDTEQDAIVYGMYDSSIQGNRWSTATFTFTSADSHYDSGGSLALVPAGINQLNVTILEINYATIPVTQASSGLRILPDYIAANVIPGVTTPQSFSVSLGSAPLGPVTISLPDQGRYTLSPHTLTFTSANFGTPQVVTVTFMPSNVLIGTKTTVQNFTGAVSTDPNYSGLRLRALVFTFGDPLNIVKTLSPPFAYVMQSGGTVVTLSYDSPATFIPSPCTPRAHIHCESCLSHMH
jgi:hypothetical protein